MKKGMHSVVVANRGFTLFTALVAFILIVLAMLLVQSMISTERSVSDVITDISSQEEMQAIADLSRADALQVFNYNVRYSIEEFSVKDTEPKDSKPDNPYYIFARDPVGWEEMQSEFVKDRFGVRSRNASGSVTATTQFASLAARHIISLLQKVPDSRGYRIDLTYPEQGSPRAESEMTQILQSTFQKQADTSDFFNVIKCDGGNYKGCVGTFYVTLDLSPAGMDAQTYDKFPLVQVEEIQTVRVIKEAILPRGKFRLYVPIRLFKALAGSREIAYANGAGILENDLQNVLEAKATKAEMEAGLKERVGQLLTGKGLKNPQGTNILDDGFGLCTSCTPATGLGYEVVALTEKVEGDPQTTTDDAIKLVSYEVHLYFEETNEIYRVSKNGRSVYGVVLKRFAH